MKQFLLFIYALIFTLTGRSAPIDIQVDRAQSQNTNNTIDRELERAMNGARQAIEASERDFAAMYSIVAEKERELAAMEGTFGGDAETLAAMESNLREHEREISFMEQVLHEREYINMENLVAEAEREMESAIAEAHAAIDAAERSDLKTQSLDELNKAAHEQVVKELGLNARQRKQFDPIYREYRSALEKAIAAETNPASADEATQKRNLKAKLGNISATAEVKREYVDKFASVLTAEQIRQLYNTEGSIGTNIKRSDANRRRNNIDKIKGSGRMVTQDRGRIAEYSVLSVGHNINVTISPTATTLSITADDNVIDYIEATVSGGKLKLSVNANSTSNISVTAVVPASSRLSEIYATSYSNVTSKIPLKGGGIKISAMSGASVEVDVLSGDVRLEVASYGKYKGSISAGNAVVSVTSGATIQGDITCSGSCTLSATSYAKFNGNIKADAIKATIPSGGEMKGGLSAGGQLTLSVTSYGKFTGPIKAKTTVIDALSGGVINGDFAADSFRAKANSYGKINLKGSETVDSGIVELASGGVFEAPNVRVTNYRVDASSYGKANVYCTGKMTTKTTSGGQVRYDGNCTIESLSESVRRR